MSKDKKDLKDKEVEATVENTVEEKKQTSVEKENTSETSEEEAETAELIEEVSEEVKLKEKLDQEKDRYLRLFAEFENYKKRTSKERIDLFKTANSELMTAILPVLDDFDRGMVEIEKSDDKALVDGVKLIRTKLKDILSQKNLEEVKVEKGGEFDSDVHEAITQIPAPSDDLKGKIVDVVEKGYQLGDKIIRYPKVVLGIK
ncbi:MAG: nucleotide exchange factor GrpE [Flavobacteriales bacterium]|nr:nucleotide exchange factor GrpE [Flavobacteriales bacterium]